MSVCGWGSRELTSKQGTFPLIMLLSLWHCWIGQCIPSYASWVEKSFSVLIFASGKQGPELWCRVEGDSWRRKCWLLLEAQGRAGCSVFIPAVASLPYTKHEFGHLQEF